MCASPTNTLRSWTKEGSTSSSATLLRLRTTPEETHRHDVPTSTDAARYLLCVRARTQWRIEADAHQIEPVVLHVFGGVERVPAPLERFVGAFCDQPVVRLGAGGVHNAGTALQVNDRLRGDRQRPSVDLSPPFPVPAAHLVLLFELLRWGKVQQTHVDQFLEVLVEGEDVFP